MRIPLSVGDKFGDWEVMDASPVLTGVGRSTRSHYRCQCVCGVERVVNASNLRRGLSTGCGCRADASTSVRSRTHGMSETALYQVWRTMKQRCDKPNFKQYKDYGGRGIKVCARWYSFEKFLEDMGEPPTNEHTLERIDNGKGYEPGNVVWASVTTQARNKRNNVRFELDGISLTMQEWAERLGVKKATLASRIYLYRWPLERALMPQIERR